MLIKGFRFGLLLQIAVGPVCLYVIKTATESGIFPAEAAAAAATLVDALFVTMAIFGVGSLLDKPAIKQGLKRLGVLVLTYFGVGVILGCFGIHIIPSLSGASIANTSGAFLTSFILTASSPLTILFWSGVFATKMTVEGYTRRAMVWFGLGAVLSTWIALGAVALAAGMLHSVMTSEVIRILNGIVGVVLLVFAAKMAFAKIIPTQEGLREAK